jgi:hypothetical protein
MEIRYGRWTIIDPPDTPAEMIRCVCDCGTLRHVSRYKLTTGRTKSCGCLRSELMKERNRGKTWTNLAPDRDTQVVPGARFGRWTALTLPYSEPEALSRIALCRCDCGTERAVPARALLLGRSKSCGCLRRDGARDLHQTN